ncbi:MAG: CHASE2 domain-containing protein [Acidobacteria bacterium]|nr:CHASE2 domain-containing protein [Acidobacteriota bacterium]MBI3662297.1 CHASE2 domain-containing protein [Acidobacteriota bacterium]
MGDRKLPLWDIGLGALVAAIVFLGFMLHWSPLESMELKMYDVRAKLRAGKPATNDVVIVAVDDASIQQVGRWPWPRSYMATLVDRLSEAGAKVVALDLLYSDAEINPGLERVRELRKQFQDAQQQLTFGKEAQRERTQASQLFKALDDIFDKSIKELDNDARLGDSVALSGNTVLAMHFGIPGPPLARPDRPPAESVLKNALPGATEGALKGTALDAKQIVPPIEVFAKDAKAVGHINWLPGVDGAIRDQKLVVQYDGKVYPSFALQAARTFLNLDAGEIVLKPGVVQIGTRQIPTSAQYEMLVNFYGDVKTFPHFSFVDVAADPPKVASENFKGKIVLIGFTATGLGEQRATPLSDTLPAVEYLANVIQNILDDKFIVRPAWAPKVELGAMVLFALFVMLGIPLLSAGTSAIIAAALLLLFGAGSFWMFGSKGYWIQVFYPSITLVLGYVVVVSKRYLVTEKAKEVLETESVETTKMLGLSFQGQGMLDMAWEKFRRVPVDTGMKDTLYNLALDFERKRQFNKAVAVYEHIATADKNFKDIAERIPKLIAVGDTIMLGTAGLKRGGVEATIMAGGPDLKTTLGRYEVIKELGKGAMGTVFLGKDPKINRQVAIKTLRFDDEDLDPEDKKALRERFFREAESAGRLTHPNIVNIFDAGEDQDINFIAMELLDGYDLKEWCGKGKMRPIKEVLDTVAKVADGLDYAHEQGIVHRDIKPANIMMLKNGVVKITDFGIARITDQSKTATGTVMGTPSYMSPEQLAGKKVDGRSDLFSLGVALYEFLTGEKPFTGESVATLVYQISTAQHASPKVHNQDLPDLVEAIIDKALQKDPAQRYQRASQMAADLRAAAAKLSAAAPAD